jgi:polyribonucleotide nucleotidyltransferase
VVKVGDRVQVKVIEIDDQDRVKLSRKALLPPKPEGEDAPSRPSNGGERGERGGRRERRD